MLLVEDDKSIREVFSIALRDEGHIVEEAGDGIEALESLRREAPDVVVLDMMMPRMDGPTFLNTCRGLSLQVTVPVVLMSAGNGIEMQARQLGIRDWLRKPLELDALTAVVARLACSHAA